MTTSIYKPYRGRSRQANTREQRPWPLMFTLGVVAILVATCSHLKTYYIGAWDGLFYVQLALSIASFSAYGFDKYRANNAGWRTRETSLLLLDALGGWPGGFAGQHYFRHKARKASFQILFWVIVLLHEIWCISWLIS